MPPVIVVGAGLAGLNCARILRRSGKRVIVLEAADRPGGLVATDTVRGHRIDRGFQVLQAAYPEANAALHYGSLRLRPFYPGALLRHGSRWRLFADPWRRPVASLASLFGGPGGLMDRLRVGWLRLGVSAERLDRLLSRPDMKTREMLRKAGFSDGFIS
ncbi:MAG: FAD-dependent oxidoreductase [Planctomycetota bacterium]